MLAKALASASASAPKVYVEDVFSTWLYTGTGSTQTITNGIDLSGEGGLVWIKGRASTYAHSLTDTIRGTNKQLFSNLPNAEQTDVNQITSFTSTGFTLGDNSTGSGGVNFGTGGYASWTFRKAEKFFDVVTYTGNGAASRAIAHNLGSVPGCIIVKNLTDAGEGWVVQHRSLTTGNYLELQSTNAAAGGGTGIWNNTLPTSTVFTVGASNFVNRNGATYVAYVFAHDAGGFGDSGNESVVKCGSHSTTSGSTTTVNLGWEPQWILWKVASSAGYNWFIVDNMRGLVAPGTTGARLLADSSNAEASLPNPSINITPTGFTVDGTWAGSLTTAVYIAIRRGPMKTPTDATEVFDDVTYSGTASPQNISISPNYTDLVLIKRRTSTDPPVWTDRLRGKDKYLRSSGTDAEATWGANDVINFDRQASFGLVGNTTGYVNSSGQPYISYSFRRAPGFFDVVAYTGTGVARTVPHNLGVAPELMIVKSRSQSNWNVYSAFTGATQYLNLNGTTAATVSSVRWNDTAPTSTVFTVGTSSSGSEINYIAYLFATCPGVSKVGSYTGTGTTLNIDCGFTAGARFVLIKRTDTGSTGDWYVWDTARGIVSGNDPYLLLNSTAVENTNTDYIDPLSSGFQISSTAPAAINASGGSYIFLAIA